MHDRPGGRVGSALEDLDRNALIVLDHTAFNVHGIVLVQFTAILVRHRRM